MDKEAGTGTEVPLLTIEEFEQELMTMSVATNNALMKLKVHAELGLDGAKAVEDASFRLG